MNFIELILQQKSLNTEQSILMGQWEFDKKNIPQALKAISGVFPHYSLHDETHSVTILNNIVKMLGEDTVRRMSCSDLWLLLECAYSHDLGMIVTAQRVEKALEEQEFIMYFMKVEGDESHPCHEYATHFSLKGGKLFQREELFNVDILDSIKFLLSDFFRSKHADNAKNAIDEPYREIGLESPRSVIPQRIFHVIGEICKAHGQKFDFVMGLPKEEDGIGREECHPRFIACLLRLGDLLDIDNNRFSEALLKTVKALPADSQLHYEKHKSITHININRRCIEIEASCHSPRVAQVTQDWFDWISDEFKEQTLKWNRIIPHGLRCYLPTLERLKISIDGYETIDGSKKPKFTIETAKALELLQGKDFYQNPFDAIREIIQNAVDSTLIRIFLEAEAKGKKLEGIDRGLLTFAEDYEITVSLDEKDNGDYEVTITDKGVGLRKSQLTYLMNTGSSSKDFEKKLLIERMPEWLRPSGVFGIGFQSIFLLTDKVEIWGKDYFEDGKMSVEMFSPNGPMRGDIYMKKVEENYPVGLSVRFVVKKGLNHKDNRDPFKSTPQHLELTMVENKVRDYARSSVIPIIIRNVKESREDRIKRHHFDFFDKKTNVEIGFDSDSFDFNNHKGMTLHYRNARVNGSIGNILYLRPRVNIHSGSAKDFLVLNRDAFKNPRKIERLIIETIVDFMNSDSFKDFIDMYPQNINVGYMFSFFVEYYDRKGDIKDTSRITDIHDFKINSLGKELRFRDIFSAKKLYFSTVSDRVFWLEEKEEGVMTIEANMLPLGLPVIFSEMLQLLFKLTVERHKRCYCRKKIVKGFFEGAQFVITDDEDDEDISLSMDDIKRSLTSANNRSYLNYFPGYEDIKIPSKSIRKDIYRNFVGGTFDCNMMVEKIINPFIRINDHCYDCRGDELYQYVSSQNGKSIEAIKTAYDRFVADAKNSGIVVQDNH